MAGSVIKKHVSSDTQGEEDNSSENAMAIVKVKLEEEQQEAPLIVSFEGLKRKRLCQSRFSGEQSRRSSGNAMVKVKLEEELLCGFPKGKRLSRSRPLVEKSRRFAESGLECQKYKQPGLKTRWSNERIKFAEQTLVEIMKEKGASIETPVTRRGLRDIARKKIGDTGLLDHLLKHVDGNVTPGGADRFRRCYNTEGTMQFWLESADMIKIKLESGISDPNWVPPSWWTMQTGSHDTSAVLREEIEKMKSDIKELASKQKIPDHADANETLFKELMSWRAKTDKQIAEISNSLASTQCMFKEMVSWKDKQQQLVGSSNSQNNLQANGSTSFSPAPENWEHILQTANLDDFTGNGFEPWDVDADLIVLPDAVRPDTYTLPSNPCNGSFEDPIWLEEQSLPNIEMQMTESCMTRGESRSSNQDKADLTPGSSVTPGPRSDIDDPNILSQETLKELVTWKAKAEQQLTDISSAVLALQGHSEANP